jgi:hypothetical protein
MNRGKLINGGGLMNESMLMNRGRLMYGGRFNITCGLQGRKLCNAKLLRGAGCTSSLMYRLPKLQLTSKSISIF